MITPNDKLSFDNLGIAPKLLDILNRHKFTTPTPIQQQSIPSAIAGKDLIGIAQTGTGKTLAFGIPMIQRLAQSGGKSRGLIVLPTRELALQVNESLKKIGGSLGMRTAILIGGEPMSKQLRILKTKPHILIVTPGRLIDHLDHKSVDLTSTHILVLDEADRMLDMGFAPQINKILEKVPKQRQTLLFSATMPDSIVKIANSYMSIPLRVEVAPAGSAVKSVTQEIFFVDRKDKISLLKNILIEYKGSVLVFSRTKHGAKKIAHTIRGFGETSTEIHSNRSLNQRIEALNGFKIGKYRVMVATDIAARGIDVTGIQLVINYDLPDHAEDYVHRIGRTGRASSTGHAISFATHDQKHDVRTIERLIRTTLPVSKTPTLPKSDPNDYPAPDKERSKPSSYSRHTPRTDSRKSFSPRPAHKTYARTDSRTEPKKSYSPAGKPAQRTNSSRNKRSEYERGRKQPPQSLKKISPSASGYYISRKVYTDED